MAFMATMMLFIAMLARMITISTAPPIAALPPLNRSVWWLPPPPPPPLPSPADSGRDHVRASPRASPGVADFGVAAGCAAAERFYDEIR